MIIDQDIANLIATLEYEIGNQTYNPNSYNGWTGEEGCGFRYPVEYCETKRDLEDHDSTRTRGMIYSIDPECVETIKYRFGSNHLYIGMGLANVLKYLENRYNLDFNMLENAIKTKRLKALTDFKNKLKKGETVKIKKGTYQIGVDIPVGIYYVNRILEDTESDYIMLNFYDEDGDFKECIIIEDTSKIIHFEEGDSVYSGYPYELRQI